MSSQRGERTGEVFVSDQQGRLGSTILVRLLVVRLETGDAVLLYSLQLDIARIIVFSLEMSIQWHDDR